MKQLVRALSKRLRLTVSRGVVQLVNDALKCQGLQVSLLSDELADDVERFQEYGFTSVPFVGAEVLFLSVGGNRAAGVVGCVTDRRHRPLSLVEGDVALFTDKGARVYLDRVADIVHIGGVDGSADFVALAAAVLTEAQNLNTHMAALEAVISGVAIPEAGMGAPSALQAAMAVAIAATPLPTPASTAATKVKAT